MSLHSRASGLLAALVLTLSATSCDYTELPMAPSSLTSGIILYEHANFLGNSAHLTGDVPDLRDFRGPCFEGDDASGRNWNDCVSSIKVAPGWRATIYRGANYHDESIEISDDVPNLELVRLHDCDHGGMNDCITSVRVRER